MTRGVYVLSTVSRVDYQCFLKHGTRMSFVKHVFTRCVFVCVFYVHAVCSVTWILYISFGNISLAFFFTITIVNYIKPNVINLNNVINNAHGTMFRVSQLDKTLFKRSYLFLDWPLSYVQYGLHVNITCHVQYNFMSHNYSIFLVTS